MNSLVVEKDIEKINVLVVDDHKLFRGGLIRFLKDFEAISECDEARSGEMAIEVLEKKTYQIVLLDRRMDGIGGLEAARIIRKRFPDSKIIIMTGIGSEDKHEVIEMINLGIAGYIYKGGYDDDSLEDIINTILDGGQYFNPEIIKIYEEYRADKQKFVIEIINKPYLTKKELQVVILICQGFISSEIADKLNVSINTVNTHRQNILKKLNLNNSPAIVEYAINNGIYKPQK